MQCHFHENYLNFLSYDECDSNTYKVALKNDLVPSCENVEYYQISELKYSKLSFYNY